jgi:hypothetical protein
MKKEEIKIEVVEKCSLRISKKRCKEDVEKMD